LIVELLYCSFVTKRTKSLGGNRTRFTVPLKYLFRLLSLKQLFPPNPK